MHAKAFVLIAAMLACLCLPTVAAADTTEQPLSLKEDRGKLFVGYDSTKIRVFDSSNLELLDTFKAEIRHVFSMETDAEHIYYGTDGIITNTSVTTKTVAITKSGELVAYSNSSSFILGMTIDGRKLYTCEGSGVISIRSMPDLELLGRINNTGLCRSIRVDDKYIYAPSGFGSIGIWYRANLTGIMNISAASKTVRSLWDDSEKMYSVSDDNTFKIWNKTDFSLIFQKELRDPWDMTGDNRYIYATSAKSIIVMDKNGGDVATLQTSPTPVSVFDLYTSGNKLYAAHQDGTVRIWDTDMFNNTVTSEVFIIKSKEAWYLPVINNIFYILLAVGIIGFVATSIYERRKKKKAATQPASATPVQPPVASSPPSHPSDPSQPKQ